MDDAAKRESAQLTRLWLNAFTTAMEAEVVSDEARRRILNRVLLGDPDGLAKVSMAVENAVAAMDPETLLSLRNGGWIEAAEDAGLGPVPERVVVQLPNDEALTAHERSILDAVVSQQTIVHAEQQTPEEAAGKLPLAGYHGTAEMRTWFGEANGRVAKFVTAAPEHGGPTEVFVRPILTPETQGLELVDSDSRQLAFSATYCGTPPAPAVDAGPADFVTWLREQITEDREHAEWLDGDSWLDVTEVQTAEAVQRFSDKDTVLAQCDAHEAILDAYENAEARRARLVEDFTRDLTKTADLDPSEQRRRYSEVSKAEGLTSGYGMAVRMAASAYQHRPGYLDAWRA